MRSDPQILAASRSSFASRIPFYYGWINVVIASFAMSATLPGRTYGLGLIKEPLRADLGISDLQFNVFNFWAIIIGATLCIPVGRLIDRLGTRVVLLGVTIALAISVLAMSRVENSTTLFLTLTLVRGLGQGALSVVAIALVAKWFKKRAGPAMAVFTVLLAIGFVVPISVVGAVVTEKGWRSAWELVGFALLLGLAPLGWLFARSTPEAIGATPDEPAPEELNASAPVTLSQAIQTSSFWIFTLAATFFNFTFSALTLDNALLLREHGLDETKLNNVVLGILMVSGLPANIIAGWLARKQPMGKLLGVGVAMMAASLLVFPFVTNTATAIIYAALLGVSGGIITVIYFAVYGHTYGRTHLGSIQATVQVISVFASALGPVVLAYCREKNGGVTSPFFFLSAGIAIVLALVAWRVRPFTSTR